MEIEKTPVPQMIVLQEKDFLIPPKKIQKFKWEEPVSRDNWMSYIETSFRFSQGSQSTQFLIYEWSRVNMHLDWQSSFTNFFDLIDKDTEYTFLSSEEKAVFINSYKQIRKSHPEQSRMRSDIEILDSLREQVEGIMDDADEFSDMGTETDSLKSISPQDFGDFITEIATFRRKSKGR